MDKRQEEVVCIECQECCKWMGIIIPSDEWKERRKFYEVRGCEVARTEGDDVYVLLPSVCPHLTPNGCDIYDYRPNYCREYDGRDDPAMRGRCKLYAVEEA